MSDRVDHPSHYGGDTTYEVIKVLAAWLTPDEYAGFLKGNVIKYLARCRLKGGAEDVAKAKWYQDELARVSIARAVAEPARGPGEHPFRKPAEEPLRPLRPLWAEAIEGC